jgi:hypothetical protein
VNHDGDAVYRGTPERVKLTNMGGETDKPIFREIMRLVMCVKCVVSGLPPRSSRELRSSVFVGGGGGFLNPEDGTDRFPETSVRNYLYSLRNNPEERSSHLRNVRVDTDM